MKLSSEDRMKATERLMTGRPRKGGPSSTVVPFLSRRNPLPMGSSFSFMRNSHSGWVKSPVASRPMPLTLAQGASVSRTMSRDVAREYLECM
jgi:hypothetical protein